MAQNGTALQLRIHRLALQRQDSKNAFMHAPQRLTPHKALQRLDAERKFTQRQAALGAESTGANQPIRYVGCGSTDNFAIIFIRFF